MRVGDLFVPIYATICLFQFILRYPKNYLENSNKIRMSKKKYQNISFLISMAISAFRNLNIFVEFRFIFLVPVSIYSSTLKFIL